MGVPLVTLVIIHVFFGCSIKFHEDKTSSWGSGSTPVTQAVFLGDARTLVREIEHLDINALR